MAENTTKHYHCKVCGWNGDREPISLTAQDFPCEKCGTLLFPTSPAPAEQKGVRMKTGSDDQCKVYLNGKEVFQFTEERAADKDQDTTEVTLRRGVNVLVVKVVNVKVDWSFCVRFTDKDDKPLTQLKSKTTE